jgi:gamma-glutamylcyclotransferase (GGCT)/AIG2-like uncharacterized protein YtfP
MRGTAAHGFPAIHVQPGHLVEGEVFWLSPQSADSTMADCDRLEDLKPGMLTGPYYRRARVLVECGGDRLVAWAYVSPETQVDADHGVILNETR